MTRNEKKKKRCAKEGTHNTNFSPLLDIGFSLLAEDLEIRLNLGVVELATLCLEDTGIQTFILLVRTRRDRLTYVLWGSWRLGSLQYWSLISTDRVCADSAEHL